MSALYAWLRSHQLLVDGVLATALGLLSLQPLLHGPWTQLAACIPLVAAVFLRRKIPATAFWVGAAGGAMQVAGAEFLRASYVAVRHSDAGPAVHRRCLPPPAAPPSRPCLSASPGLSWPRLVWLPTPNPARVEQIAFAAALLSGCVLLAWVLGDSMRYRRGYYAALEDKAARLEAERDAQAKIAAAAERARIARELHDIVAHHVSVMVVQADGAQYALRTDSSRAETALAAISTTGRQALTEMRRLLGVLRTAG